MGATAAAAFHAAETAHAMAHRHPAGAAPPLSPKQQWRVSMKLKRDAAAANAAELAAGANGDGRWRRGDRLAANGYGGAPAQVDDPALAGVPIGLVGRCVGGPAGLGLAGSGFSRH